MQAAAEMYGTLIRNVPAATVLQRENGKTSKTAKKAAGTKQKQLVIRKVSTKQKQTTMIITVKKTVVPETMDPQNLRQPVMLNVMHTNIMTMIYIQTIQIM